MKRVNTNYGRIGMHGILRTYWPESTSALQALVTKNLRKRLQAQKRIECDYKISAFKSINLLTGA